MTAQMFAQACAGYYGRWRQKDHAEAIAEYLRSKSGRFIAGLFAVLKEVRSYTAGPPSRSDLQVLADQVVARMVLDQPVQIDDEPLATQAEIAAVLAETTARLSVKIQEGRNALAPRDGELEEKRPMFFPELEGVRPDAPVTLSEEFYDETLPMEERIERYAVRRAQVQAARKEREK